MQQTARIMARVATRVFMGGKVIPVGLRRQAGKKASDSWVLGFIGNYPLPLRFQLQLIQLQKFSNDWLSTLFHLRVSAEEDGSSLVQEHNPLG